MQQFCALLSLQSCDTVSQSPRRDHTCPHSVSPQALRPSRLSADVHKHSHIQVKSACASGAIEHGTPSRCNRIDEAQKSGATRPSIKQAIFQKTVGVTADAFPTVLRKQRPKRRGVSEAVQRSSSNVRKRKSMSGRRSRVGVRAVCEGIPGKAHSRTDK